MSATAIATPPKVRDRVFRDLRARSIKALVELYEAVEAEQTLRDEVERSGASPFDAFGEQIVPKAALDLLDAHFMGTAVDRLGIRSDETFDPFAGRDRRWWRDPAELTKISGGKR